MKKNPRLARLLIMCEEIEDPRILEENLLVQSKDLYWFLEQLRDAAEEIQGDLE